MFDLVFTTKEDGADLGLISYKAAVVQHGGSLRVHNDPTTFVVELPKEKSANMCRGVGLEELY